MNLLRKYRKKGNNWGKRIKSNNSWREGEPNSEMLLECKEDVSLCMRLEERERGQG
jgi:hypothetical protein